ncbi:hypothetical protein KC357_g218 [Hortaea werneckii]|nr:hypothetical protein KC357_g218 [Hortaea werneckii]
MSSRNVRPSQCVATTPIFSSKTMRPASLLVSFSPAAAPAACCWCCCEGPCFPPCPPEDERKTSRNLGATTPSKARFPVGIACTIAKTQQRGEDFLLEHGLRELRHDARESAHEGRFLLRGFGGEGVEEADGGDEDVVEVGGFLEFAGAETLGGPAGDETGEEVGGEFGRERVGVGVGGRDVEVVVLGRDRGGAAEGAFVGAEAAAGLERRGVWGVVEGDDEEAEAEHVGARGEMVVEDEVGRESTPVSDSHGRVPHSHEGTLTLCPAATVLSGSPAHPPPALSAPSRTSTRHSSSPPRAPQARGYSDVAAAPTLPLPSSTYPPLPPAPS